MLGQEQEQEQEQVKVVAVLGLEQVVAVQEAG